jgi:hypothetical protein
MKAKPEHAIVGYALLALIGLVAVSVLHELIGTAGIGLLLLAVGVILFMRSIGEDRH